MYSLERIDHMNDNDIYPMFSFYFDDDYEEIPIGDLNRLFRRHVLIEADSLSVPEQLKLKRVHDCLTQSQLASRLGMATSTLCEIETGRRRIAKKYWPSIERYLYRELYYGGVLTDVFDDL